MLMTRDQLVALCEQYNLGTFGNKSKLLDRIREHRRRVTWCESDEVEEVDDDDDLNAEGAELVGEQIYGRKRRRRKKKK